MSAETVVADKDSEDLVKRPGVSLIETKDLDRVLAGLHDFKNEIFSGALHRKLRRCLNDNTGNGDEERRSTCPNDSVPRRRS